MKQKLIFHPWRVFTYLSILGISSAFFTLVSCLAFTWSINPIPLFKLPNIFHANTFIMIVSSYSLLQVKHSLVADNHEQMRFNILVTIGLGFLFMIFQLIGWHELSISGIDFKKNITGTYIYLLSGLHMLHLIVGVGWLILIAIRNTNLQHDVVELLLFETSPSEKLKINMAILYWHFVDILWLCLYIFFLILLCF
jgi:cytochrome c oxidase subunit 3